MQEVLVFGAGGHAKVVIDIIEKQAIYKIAGIIDISGLDEFFKYKILGSEEELTKINIKKGIIAIGDNYIREKLAAKITKIIPDFQFITAIHPSAVISRNVQIMEGSVVMPGVVINADSKIGKHAIINSSSSIDHDCFISDFATIAPGVIIGGNVRVGYASVIALGSKVVHKVNIGDYTVIGAGSLVLKNVENNLVVYGFPAKPIRNRNSGDNYL